MSEKEEDHNPTPLQEYQAGFAIDKARNKMYSDEFNQKFDALKEKYGGVENIPQDEIGKIMFIGTSADSMGRDIYMVNSMIQLCNILGLKFYRTELIDLFRRMIHGLLEEKHLPWVERLYNEPAFRRVLYEYLIQEGDITESGVVLHLCDANYKQLKKWLAVPWGEMKSSGEELFNPPIHNFSEVDSHLESDDDEQEAT